MGLDIGVGWLSRWKEEVEPDEFVELRRPYDLLNEVLAQGGRPPHVEPEVPESSRFDAQMWGYSGLHAVRRLAAYDTIKNSLPPEFASQNAHQDPVLMELFARHGSHYQTPPKGGLLNRIFSKKAPKPNYQHLLWHSDCEGFYVPQVFEDVILDNAEPQRPGLGGCVGSAVKLLDECRQLARRIELPEGIDPEDDTLWAIAENPDPEGPAWRRFGVEAFCLARLIRGCERALEYRAVLAFG